MPCCKSCARVRPDTQRLLLPLSLPGPSGASRISALHLRSTALCHGRIAHLLGITQQIAGARLMRALGTVHETSYCALQSLSRPEAPLGKRGHNLRIPRSTGWLRLHQYTVC